MGFPKILIMHNEDHDWCALYLDGELACEGHDLTATELLEALGVDYKEGEVTQEWIESVGACFPVKASKLPKDHK